MWPRIKINLGRLTPSKILYPFHYKSVMGCLNQRKSWVYEFYQHNTSSVAWRLRPFLNISSSMTSLQASSYRLASLTPWSGVWPATANTLPSRLMPYNSKVRCAGLSRTLSGVARRLSNAGYSPGLPSLASATHLIVWWRRVGLTILPVLCASVSLRQRCTS
jgi:hypothetical protein